MKLARQQGITCQVFKRLDYNFILILIKDISKVHLLLETFKVPNGCYEINKEERTVLIQLKKGDKYYCKFNPFKKG